MAAVFIFIVAFVSFSVLQSNAYKLEQSTEGPFTETTEIQTSTHVPVSTEGPSYITTKIPISNDGHNSINTTPVVEYKPTITADTRQLIDPCPSSTCTGHVCGFRQHCTLVRPVLCIILLCCPVPTCVPN